MITRANFGGFIRAGRFSRFPLARVAVGLSTCVVPGPDLIDWKDLPPPKQWRASNCPVCGHARELAGHFAPHESLRAICPVCIQKSSGRY